MQNDRVCLKSSRPCLKIGEMSELFSCETSAARENGMYRCSPSKKNPHGVGKRIKVQTILRKQISYIKTKQASGFKKGLQICGF